MQNKGTKIGHKTVTMILNVLMILLCFVLVITCVLVTKEVKDGYTSYADEDTFYYAIKAENFSYVVDSYHRNVVSSNGDKKSLLEYYGVAKYFEAASLYHAYDTVGNEEMAERFKKKMDMAVAEMGSWAVAKEPIDKKLGLQ